MPILLLIIGLAVITHVVLTWRSAIAQGKNARDTQQTQPETPVGNNFPKASVLIPAWKEYGTLEHCIASLKLVNYPDWEVIIAAGGPDGTFEYAQNLCADIPNFHVIEQPPKGKNAALNLALQYATGEVIVILDADSRVSPEWLKELIKPIMAGAEASTGNYFPERRTPVSLCSEMEKIAGYEIHHGTTLQGSGSIALRREVIDALGGFDENIVVGVDWDLNLQVEQKGFKRAYASQAIVHTERPATLAEYWKNEVRWRRAHLWLLWLRRDWFARSAFSLLGATLFYVVTLALTGAIVLIVLSLILGLDEISILLTGLTILFLFWILARRAALAGKIAAYTGERHWLKYTGTLMLLLLITMAATWRAVMTLHKKTAHFKGPRILAESRNTT